MQITCLEAKNRERERERKKLVEVIDSGLESDLFDAE